MCADDKRPSQTPGLLQSVFSAGTLITAWIFAVGWTYLHTYYRHFGVNVNSLGFPSYHYLLFAFAQFASFLGARLLLGSMCLTITLLVAWGVSTQKPRWAIVLGALYLLLFWLGFRVAFSEGRSAALTDMSPCSALPEIAIEIRQGSESKLDLVLNALNTDDLRVLYENSDRILVFVPIKVGVSTLRVIDVDRKNVLYSIRTTNVGSASTGCNGG
jgi:hypothetical protein